MSDDRSIGNALGKADGEILALERQVAAARGKLGLQHDAALYEALSAAEIRAERELAEWIRTQRRKQRRRAVVEELAAERRDRRAGAQIRRTDEADARWHRKALAARRRVDSPDARLAQLYRRAEWSSRALIGVVVLGMLWAGVNVQRNLVPSGDMTDPLYWLSYGIEAMISIPIIVIMIAATTAARWGRELQRGKVIVFELALLGTTVALNAGPHLAAGSYGRAAEYAIAPVMVGVVIWLHAWVAARYATLIEAASIELPTYTPAERVSPDLPAPTEFRVRPPELADSPAPLSTHEPIAEPPATDQAAIAPEQLTPATSMEPAGEHPGTAPEHTHTIVPAHRAAEPASATTATDQLGTTANTATTIGKSGTTAAQITSAFEQAPSPAEPSIAATEKASAAAHLATTTAAHSITATTQSVPAVGHSDATEHPPRTAEHFRTTTATAQLDSEADPATTIDRRDATAGHTAPEGARATSPAETGIAATEAIPTEHVGADALATTTPEQPTTAAAAGNVSAATAADQLGTTANTATTIGESGTTAAQIGPEVERAASPAETGVTSTEKASVETQLAVTAQARVAVERSEATEGTHHAAVGVSETSATERFCAEAGHVSASSAQRDTVFAHADPAAALTGGGQVVASADASLAASAPGSTSTRVGAAGVPSAADGRAVGEQVGPSAAGVRGVGEQVASGDGFDGEMAGGEAVERTDGVRAMAEKSIAPGTFELIHQVAVDHRRNGADRGTRGNGSTRRRIPVAAAQSPAGDATGTDPVLEATAHADSVARDPNGDTAGRDAAAVPTAPQPRLTEPEQLTLTTEPEPTEPASTRRKSAAPKRTEPAPAQRESAEPAATQDTRRRPSTAASTALSAQTAEELDNEPPSPNDLAPTDHPAPPDDLDTLVTDFDYDDTEVRALARQIAHRSPLRLTLAQIEEILELTDQSWSAPSIGAEVGVSGNTVTNIVEFARKIRHPYAFTG